METRIDSKQCVRVIVGFGGGYDKYQQNKFTCAVILGQSMNEWVYVTQWASGTCLFVNADHDQYVSVNPVTEKCIYSLIVKQ